MLSRLLVIAFFAGAATLFGSTAALFHYSNVMKRYPQAYCEAPEGAYRLTKMDRRDVCLSAADVDTLDRNRDIMFVGIFLVAVPSFTRQILKRREAQKDGEPDRRA